MPYSARQVALAAQSTLRTGGAVFALSLISTASLHAGDKKSAPAPRAAAPSRPAPSAPHASGGGGAPHMPGNMGGGARPGGAGGGAHLPSNMGGGAHMPSNMGGAHAPGGQAAHHASPANASHAGRSASAEHHNAPNAAGHHDAAGTTRTAEHDAHGAGHEGEHAGAQAAGHHDPRIGGGAALHTRLAAGAAIGVGAGLAAHHFGEGREGAGHDFRQPPGGRDIGHDRDFAAAHAHDFHARFVRDFSAAEFGRWRGGAWGVGWHFGRFGWWWDVGGVWYPYDEPIYPFPLEVSALTVYGDPYVAAPALAAGPAIAPLPAAPAALYSCASPPGYFPAVGSCGQPWQMTDAPPDGN
jgi:hypothetical protein